MSLSIKGFIQQIDDTCDALPDEDKKQPTERAVVAPKGHKRCDRCGDTDYEDAGLINEAGYCSDCQKCIDRGYDILSKAGRCANGGERDRGVVFHAVLLENDTDVFDYMSDKAVCGTAPSGRSVGWSSWKPEDREVTCPRCLARLERLGK